MFWNHYPTTIYFKSNMDISHELFTGKGYFAMKRFFEENIKHIFSTYLFYLSKLHLMLTNSKLKYSR